MTPNPDVQDTHCTDDPHVKVTRVGIGIVRRGRSFLIRQRPEGTPLAGYWEFPGGKCVSGETPDAAASRECFEEIGMPVVVARARASLTHEYPHGIVELHFFDCVPGEETSEPEPDSGFVWVDVSELVQRRFPEANGTILDSLLKEFGNRE